MPDLELIALETALTGAEEVLRHDEVALVKAQKNVEASIVYRNAAAQALHDYKLKK